MGERVLRTASAISYKAVGVLPNKMTYEQRLKVEREQIISVSEGEDVPGFYRQEMPVVFQKQGGWHTWRGVSKGDSPSDGSGGSSK